MLGNSEGIIFTLFMSNHINPKDVFVVIPAYNENSIIQSVIQKLLPFNYNIVVVDDGSAQSLYPVLDKMPVYYIRHKVNLGQGAALQTGIDFVLSKKAKYIVTFDADGQHQPSDIDKLLLVLINDKADIVSGSRFLEGASHNMSAKRKFLLQMARYINFAFAGLLLTDAHNGLRAMTREAAQKIELQENGMAHATEILHQIKKKKLKHKEVPVTINYSDYSTKKGQTLMSSFRIFFDLLLNKLFK
jgi:glycosyltransferase involved in cell wall biosynthesis